MEHIRSTLATTAAAVFGLVVAAHVLHPGNFEEQPRPEKRADAMMTAPAPAPISTVAWTDPPAALRGTETAVLGTVTDASPIPRLAVALPQDVATTPPSPREMTAPAAAVTRKAVRATRTGKGAAQHVSRNRRAGLSRVAAVTSLSPTAQGVERSANTTANPIGGLMRGLGLDLGS